MTMTGVRMRVSPLVVVGCDFDFTHCNSDLVERLSDIGDDVGGGFNTNGKTHGRS